MTVNYIWGKMHDTEPLCLSSLEGRNTLLSRLHYKEVVIKWYISVMEMYQSGISSIFIPVENAGYECNDYTWIMFHGLVNSENGKHFFFYIESFLQDRRVKRTGVSVIVSLDSIHPFLHCSVFCDNTRSEVGKAESEPSNSAKTERRHWTKDHAIFIAILIFPQKAWLTVCLTKCLRVPST